MSAPEGSELLSQGAEARVRAMVYLGRPAVVKERFRKRYRLPELDEKLTRQRVQQEARCLLRARKAGVDTPCVFFVDLPGAKIYMERVRGRPLRQHFNELLAAGRLDDAKATAYEMGKVMSRIHNANLCHGDATTSNFIVREGSGRLCTIDFGLGQQVKLHEDKAVDLYVLERALLATHAGAQPLVEEVMRSYKHHSRTANQVMQRLSEVRMRGRKRECFG